MEDIEEFLNYFQTYRWENKHHLYGYPADCYDQFAWIKSLEDRFAWLRENYANKNTASIYLIREMIQWGGSQNGVLQKFDDKIGEVNLFDMIRNTISKLDNPEQAIRHALQIPGMGLTYASKLLRFLKPEKYGALDNQLRNALHNDPNIQMPIIYDGNVNNMVNGYLFFINILEDLKNRLEQAGIDRPPCALPRNANNNTGWRSADIEMALFSWAQAQNA